MSKVFGVRAIFDKPVVVEVEKILGGRIVSW